MIKIFCFTESVCEHDKMYQFLVNFDSDQFEIHLYTNILTEKTSPDTIWGIMEKDILLSNSDSYFFMTDLLPLFQIIYRIYGQSVHAFLYYDTQNNKVMQYEEFSFLGKIPYSHHEYHGRPIFTNNMSLFFNRSLPIYSLESISSYLNSNMLLIPSKKQSKKKEIYYYNQNCYYLFMPTGGNIITIGNQVPPDCNNTLLLYHTKSPFHELIKELLCITRKETSDFSSDLLNRTSNLLELLKEIVQTDTPFIYFLNSFIQQALKNSPSLIGEVLLLSFAIRITKDNTYYTKLCSYALDRKQLSPFNKYWLWFQIRRLSLDLPQIVTSEGGKISTTLYQNVYQEFYKTFPDHCIPIPSEQRNKKLIFLFTTSFLGERHAPTRTVLERCYTLGKLLHYNIVLINTREYCTQKGMLPFYCMYEGNVINEFCEKDTITYKDFTFSFYQPLNKMPDLETISYLLQMIKDYKPYFILSIGSGSILADLSSNIVPVLSMSVTFSTLPVTMSPLLILGKNLTMKEWENLLNQGYKKDNIIESRFTFDLIPKHSEYTRESFSLPTDKFLIAIIGLRLDAEIDDKFIFYLSKTFVENTHLVFAGYFNHYNDLCEKFPELKKHSTFIGYCNDVQALMSICDLYVNPIRIGGGFSIIEAFQVGRPGVTTDYGDVSISAGSDFCVKDYDEMVLMIIKYKNDKNFYKEMSLKAKARALYMTDSLTAMKSLLSKAFSSKYFF